jgi:hypothetical protein
MYVNDFFCALQHFFGGMRYRYYPEIALNWIFSKCYKINALGAGRLSVVTMHKNKLEADCEQSIDFQQSIDNRRETWLQG